MSITSTLGPRAFQDFIEGECDEEEGEQEEEEEEQGVSSPRCVGTARVFHKGPRCVGTVKVFHSVRFTYPVMSGRGPVN